MCIFCGFNLETRDAHSLSRPVSIASVYMHYTIHMQARLAQQFNCSALLIYSDPEDYAPDGVPVYPNGPSLPTYGVQRGSLLHRVGDPLTPDVPAVGNGIIVIFNSVIESMDLS